MNTEKKIEDYLPFYMGCEVEFGYEGRKKKWQLIGKTEPFGWQVFDPSRVLAPYHCVRVELLKPLLRQLSDMTEEELQECGNMIYDFSDEPELNNHGWEDFETLLAPEQFHWLLKKHFDLFGLIESGLAINKTP